MLKKYFSVLTAVLLMLMLFCGCVNTNDASIVPGDVFLTEERIFSSSLNSVIGTPDIVYTIKENAIEGEFEGSSKEFPVEKWEWQEFPYSEEEWNAMFFEHEIFSLEEYGKIMYQPIDLFHFMLLSNGEIWYVQLFPDNSQENHFWVWYIDKLAPAEK